MEPAVRQPSRTIAHTNGSLVGDLRTAEFHRRETKNKEVEEKAPWEVFTTPLLNRLFYLRFLELLEAELLK